jgi:hypothetical protein
MKKESKRKLYLSLWIIVGILLGVIIAGVVELTYLNFKNSTNFIFIIIYLVMIFTGIITGRWIGPKAWKKIYIDGIRGKKYLN